MAKPSEVIAFVAFFATVAAACNGTDVAAARKKTERTAVLQLRSRNPAEVQVGFASLQRIPHLSPETVDALVAELGRPRDGHLLANDTLMTIPTPATRVLARHRESGERVRLALRSDRSPQVRRFAALALGDMRYDAAIPDLRVAIRNAMAAPDADEIHGTERDPRAILDASVNSYAKIDYGGAVEYLVSFLLNDQIEARQRAYEAMSLLQIDAGPPACTHEEVISGQCGRIWHAWLTTTKHKYKKPGAPPQNR
jgi:hypothetical protein